MEISAKDFVLLGAGGAIGAAASFAVSIGFWLIWSRLLVAKIEFGDKIRKKANLGEYHPRYHIKIKNSGKRKIVDIHLRARICFFQLIDKTRHHWHYFDIELGTNHIPVLWPSNTRLVRLKIDESPDLLNMPTILDYHKKIKNHETNLEELLLLSSVSYIRLYVSCRDEFSGSLSNLISKRYALPDVRSGSFSDLNLVEDSELSTGLPQVVPF